MYPSPCPCLVVHVRQPGALTDANESIGTSQQNTSLDPRTTATWCGAAPGLHPALMQLYLELVHTEHVYQTGQHVP